MTSAIDVHERRPMREVNDAMWESLANGGYEDPIPFFCECDEPRCYQAVWLLSDDYSRARLDPRWRALHAAHRLAVVQPDGCR